MIDVIEETSFNVPTEAAKDSSAVFFLQNPMDLVLDFSRTNPNEPETVRLRIRVLAPNGDQLGGSNLDLDMQTALRSRGFVRIPGLPVQSAGTYKFDIQILDDHGNWSTVTEVALPVRILPAATT
jgi:hypothetical protein